MAAVAFDVDIGHAAVPQIEQDDRQLVRLVLDQAIADNGESWQVANVYVPGIAPLDRRNEAWTALLARYPKVEERAVFGTLQPPIAETTAALAAAVLASNPDITVVFAPYDEFAKGVKQAAEAVGAAGRVRIYSADISNADIAAMREPGSPWVPTAATDPAAIGRVSVHAPGDAARGPESWCSGGGAGDAHHAGAAERARHPHHGRSGIEAAGVRLRGGRAPGLDASRTVSGRSLAYTLAGNSGSISGL